MYEGAVQELIDELGRLPGVGPKSAQRLAFHILEADPQDMKRLVEAITTVKERVKFCTVCGNVTEQEMCNICRDPRRDPSVICVVEESKDVLAVERTRSFRGRYHVLGGAINPIAGVGPEQLRIRELLTRLNDGAIQEIIIATDPNLEGEATATYLARMLKSIGIAVTRLASGLPVGGDLEYADEVTLGRDTSLSSPLLSLLLLLSSSLPSPSSPLSLPLLPSPPSLSSPPLSSPPSPPLPSPPLPSPPPSLLLLLLRNALS